MFGLFGSDNSFDVADANLERRKRMLEQIALPEYREYAPELYTGESAKYSLMSEDPALRELQLRNTARLAGLAETGESDVDRAAFMEARRGANQMARANSQAALQNAQARGASGGGMEFALREIGNQAASDRAAQANAQQVANSARQRALYAQAYGNALGGMRDQDYRVNSGNTDIINRFNEYNTGMRNRVNQANVDLRNQAFDYNQGLKDRRFENQMRRAGGLSQLEKEQAEIAYKRNARRNQQNGALTGLVGAGVGGYFGGAPGAAVGYGVGSAFGGGF